MRRMWHTLVTHENSVCRNFASFMFFRASEIRCLSVTRSTEDGWYLICDTRRQQLNCDPTALS